MLKVGDTYEKEFAFTQTDVEAFAHITGDKNPVHLDAEYAATTSFKKPIIHGALGSSVFSRVLGTEFPGVGTIYLKQESNFKRPMYVDTPYVAYFEVTDYNERRKSFTIKTTVKDSETGKETIGGEAIVMVNS